MYTRRIMLIFVTIALFISGIVSISADVPAQQESELNAVYERVVGSVVNIVIADDSGPLGGGSGFVFDEEGYIVTNNHVVEQAEYIRVTFNDNTILDAQLIGRDPDSDLAVVKVDANGFDLQPLPIADSDEAFIGQPVMAIGSPFGQSFTLTTGIVSAVERTLRGEGRFTIPEVIQTDAAINPGNSGGPLLNLNGEVLGVNTAILSGSGTGSGVGFAVPSNAVQRIIPILIEEGDYQHSYLGLSGTPLSPSQRDVMDLPDGFEGVMVADVVTGGPAAEAGLRGSNVTINTPFGEQFIEGDIITAIDGEPVAGIVDLIAYLEANTRPGDSVTLTVWREGEQIETSVTVAARPGQSEPTFAP